MWLRGNFIVVHRDLQGEQNLMAEKAFQYGKQRQNKAEITEPEARYIRIQNKRYICYNKRQLISYLGFSLDSSSGKLKVMIG